MAVDQRIQKLGTFVRTSRELRGYTLKTLEKVCGVSVSQLSKIERGVSEPSKNTVMAIAKGLDISSDICLCILGYHVANPASVLVDFEELVSKLMVSVEQRSVESLMSDARLSEVLVVWLKANDRLLSNMDIEALAQDIEDFYTIRKNRIIKSKLIELNE